MNVAAIFRPRRAGKVIKELEECRIKNVMYDNILTLIDIECRKQWLSEGSSYELKIFSTTIRDIIVNNYMANISNRKVDNETI